MICKMCNDRVATIKLKEIIGNEVTELDLCKECFEAREEKGADHGPASLGKALDSLEKYANRRTRGETKPRKCLACGTTEERVLAKGRLGCSDCYTTFAVSLRPLLSKIHGSTEHRGKAPQRATKQLDVKTELRRLHEDLHDAILSENYERAARLRDKIKHFENT